MQFGSEPRPQLPPVTDRGGKWSPLSIGLLSLAFDPAFIVSIFAMIRAGEDFRRVRDREAMGEWSPLHARVRNEAVWGLVLGLARPLFLAFIMVALFGSLAGIGFTTPAADAPAADHLFWDSELDEVLARIDSSDTRERDLARAHLEHVELDSDGALRVLELAATVDTPSVFVHIAAKSPSSAGVANVRALGARVDPEARFRYYFAASELPAGRRALVDEVDGPDALHFADLLSRHVWAGSRQARILAHDDPADLVNALITAALGDVEHAEVAGDAAFAFCEMGASRAIFQPRATELVHASRAPSSPALPILACLDDPASERVLRAALPRDERARLPLAMRGDREIAAALGRDEALRLFMFAFMASRRELADPLAVPDYWYAFQSSVWPERYVGTIEGTYLVYADDDTQTLLAIGPYQQPSEIFGREPSVRERVDPWPDDDAMLLDRARAAVGRSQPSWPGGYP